MTDVAEALQALDAWEGDILIRRQNGLWRVEVVRAPRKRWRPAEHFTVEATSLTGAIHDVLQWAASISPT